MSEEPTTFNFDEEFQEQVVMLSLRDPQFCLQTEGLIQPFYFVNEADAAVFKLASDYWEKYREVPNPSVWGQLVKDAIASRVITSSSAPDVIAKIKTCAGMKITNREYFIDKIDRFARNQAVELAIMKSAELMDKQDFETIETVMSEALRVGATKEDFDYDFFENSEQRLNKRKALVAGTITRDGVPTGIKDLDDRLYHRGLGRKELTCIAGAAKSGKSMTLITLGVNASKLGYNVLIASLEVSKEIISDRIDANIAQIPMHDLESRMAVVHGKVDSLAKSGAGKLHVVDYPSGSLSPNDLRRLLKKQESRGHVYDLIVLDYADLMRPNNFINNPIENSKSIYVDLRAIMYDYNAAGLTATQLNREGFKADVGKMEHVADDINKARIVDLLVTINATEDEKARNEARLYFAASRNQESNWAMRVRTARGMSNMITRVMGIE